MQLPRHPQHVFGILVPRHWVRLISSSIPLWIHAPTVLGWAGPGAPTRGYEDTAAASGAQGYDDLVEAVVESGHRPWSTDGAATNGTKEVWKAFQRR